MKLRRHFGFPVLALALTLAVGVPLMAKDAHTVQIGHDALLSGKQLKAGEYTVKWDANSPTATVNVWKGHKLVATADGQVVDRGTRAENNSIIYDTDASGVRFIREMRFAGSSKALTFGEDSGTQSAEHQPATAPGAGPGGSMQ